MLRQSPLPSEYVGAERTSLQERIHAAREALGKRLVILGHHYQRDEVIQFADFVGDSLKLSQLAAQQADAEFIVFCGVHFMAESADILSTEDQAVCLPNMLAGCAMADLAEDEAVAAAMDELHDATGARLIPISYVNSTAAIKAITARGGGACCTSSNVRNVFEWALRPEAEGGAWAEKILCIPDQHLGRNTAVSLSYPLEACAVYDPNLPDGGLSREQIAAAKFLLWKGHCYVHQRFRASDVQRVRREIEGVRVMVHPECPHEVVQLADASGSTEQIIRAVSESEPGSKWAIGTEANLVRRLDRENANKQVVVLSEAPSLCAQMMRIDLAHLAWCLENLADGNVVNRVQVDAATAADARAALQRMIDIRASR